MSDLEIEVKIAVGRLIELAYEKNKGLTASILAQKGTAKLTVSSDGTAILSNSVGIITFSGNPALKQIGTKIKFLSVGFENRDGMDIQYKAGVKVGLGTISVSGTFNLEKLITSCSGLLCNAARALKNQRSERDRALEEIMGR